MTAALALRTAGQLLVEPGDLFAEADANSLRDLFAEYAALRAKVEAIATIASGDLYANAMDYFLRGNSEDRQRHSLMAERVFQLAGAIKALNASFWQRALNLTDVYGVMPQVRREEWDKAIERMEVPEFEEGAVLATLNELLGARQKFFAERVDGIFQTLSHEHVTNSPLGFAKRMILGYMQDAGMVNYHRIGYLSDFRTVVCKFMGLDDPRYGTAHKQMEIAMRNWGQWINCDGGAFRLRVYKKGTAHLEVHPEMAWRLNAVLHSLYPRAIAAEHRTRPERPVKGFRMMQRPLPWQVVKILEDLKRDRFGKRFPLPYGYRDDKAAAVEAERVLESLGGVIDQAEDEVVFDYDARDALDEVIASGCIPDRMSHQYYPTPPEIAALAVEMAEIGPDDSVLEPSAGQGGLADFLPKDRTLCVEISRLRCTVLRSKGFRVVEADFLQWAETEIRAQRLVDRAVLNPPFSEGRATLHLRTAARLLKRGGRIAAVLPASMRGTEPLSDLDFREHAWSESFANEFDGTGIAVAILGAWKRGTA